MDIQQFLSRKSGQTIAEGAFHTSRVLIPELLDAHR